MFRKAWLVKQTWGEDSSASYWEFCSTEPDRYTEYVEIVYAEVTDEPFAPD